MGYRIELRRTNLKERRSVAETPVAGPGECIARVDVAALTSNNVTYAVHGGPPLHYWNVFPATDAEWGVVPVWGFGTIIESEAQGVAPGDRFYGYWPSASHLKLQPGPVTSGRFLDLAPHRQGLASVYNSYRAVGADAPPEPLAALFQPLYGTGFVLAHALQSDVAAGRTIVITSASAKTALATAFNLGAAGARTIGLTSAGNRPFVAGTGFYSQVLTYDELEMLDPAEPAVLVDFAGNGELKARLHRRLKALVASHIVGDTDWQAPGIVPLDGPRPALFFAPSAFEERAREIGPAAFNAELAESLARFLATTRDWLELHEITGPEGHRTGFEMLLENRAPARFGIIWRP